MTQEMFDRHPGLIKSEIVGMDETHVTIRETWDVTVPGCPIVVFKLTPFGVNAEARMVEREVKVPRGR